MDEVIHYQTSTISNKDTIATITIRMDAYYVVKIETKDSVNRNVLMKDAYSLLIMDEEEVNHTYIHEVEEDMCKEYELVSTNLSL